MLKINELSHTMTEKETHRFDAVSYGAWINKYSSHPIVHAFHNVRCLLVCGVVLSEGIAGEVIRTVQNWHVRRNFGYPMGGCRAIPDGMANIIRHYRGEVRLGNRVS